MEIWPYLRMLLGLVMLIKGADILVRGASVVARRLHVSDLVIGLTVVAFGTSSPELAVNLIASWQGNTDIAIGNVLGSNIANILLILGVAAVICPLIVTEGTVWREIPFSLLAALVLGILANDQLIDKAPVSELSKIDALVLCAFFVIFLYYSASIAKKINGIELHVPPGGHGLGRAILYILMGLAGLTLGGDWIVKGAVNMALALGMSEALVGLTLVAVGTSLPELATSGVAAYRGNVEIAVGNVVGSNIFNIFFVLGISAVVRPLAFQASANIDIGVAILASLLLFAFMFTGRKHAVDRWEGVLFIGLYIAYITGRIIYT